MQPAVQIRPSMRSMVNEDGAVLLDIRQGLMFNLNPVGGLIWSLVQQGMDHAALVAEMMSRFGIPREQAEADISGFLGDLERHGVADSDPKS